ncbi:hypothetical protein R1A27_06510 [Methylobacterium sp. NMS12]|uniref:hypothetical protein n=1 Tax=Methylobacterium sp. NMS12 TaxID=3079766 RepID=UPI003F882512
MPYLGSIQSYREGEKIRRAFLAGVNAFFDVLAHEYAPAKDGPPPEKPDLERPAFEQLRDREMGDYLRIVWDSCSENGAKMTHKYYAKKMVDADYEKYKGFPGEKRSGGMLFKARHDDVLKDYVHPMHL